VFRQPWSEVVGRRCASAMFDASGTTSIRNGDIGPRPREGSYSPAAAARAPRPVRCEAIQVLSGVSVGLGGRLNLLTQRLRGTALLRTTAIIRRPNSGDTAVDSLGSWTSPHTMRARLTRTLSAR
jgi:hypothetical protein